jgi:hypothetical protein
MVQDLQHKLSYELQDALVYMSETDDLAELAKNRQHMDQHLKDSNSRKERAQAPRVTSSPDAAVTTGISFYRIPLPDRPDT